MAPSDARDAPIDVARRGRPRARRSRSPRRPAGTRSPRTGGSCSGSAAASPCGTAGGVVATALALPYPPAFGWVSMVLVHAPYRRRGLATRLVERAMAALTGAGLLPVLDATPAGRGGVRPHGLPARREPAALARHGRRRRVRRAGSRPSPTRVRDLDRAAFGADRGAVLADLSARPAPVAALAAGGDGYLLSRAGRTATQLGPLVARDATTAVALLAEGLDAVGRHRRRRRAGAGDGRRRTPRRPRLRAGAAVRAAGARPRRDRRARPSSSTRSPGRSSADALAGHPRRGARGRSGPEP